jgi:hypothetical protein
VQEPESGLTRVARFRGRDEPIDLAAFARGEGRFGRQLRSRLEMGAGGKAGERCQRQRPAGAAPLDAPEPEDALLATCESQGLLPGTLA